MSKNNIKKPNIKVTVRDQNILTFIWKWKALTTATIAFKYFPNAAPFTAYCRLMQLKRAGFLKIYFTTDGSKQVWGLAPRGYKAIVELIGGVSSESFKISYPHHDHLASAFHLGEWLVNQPSQSSSFSEQQLRAYSADARPSWVLKSTRHRPDGFSIIEKDGVRTLIAFETELSLKSTKRIENLIMYYESEEKIDLIFWLVDSKNTMSALERNFKSSNSRHWSKHHFVLLSDFLKHGWLAPFISGKYLGKCPFDFLVISPPTQASQTPISRGALILLDSKKRPMFTKTSPKSKILKNP